MTDPATPNTAKLSDEQKAILRFLLAREEWMLRTGQAKLLAVWGVPWRVKTSSEDSPNASERASMSRSLRRLERRGFVTRMNDITGDSTRYTTRVLLTEVGRAAAKRLTKKPESNC